MKRKPRDSDGAGKVPISGTILVIEDDQALSRLIQGHLERLNFHVERALSGAQAMEWLAGNRATLALLDYSLPDMTGTELIKAMAENKCSIPFIVITGRGDEALAVEMMKLGARDYMVKDTSFLDRLPIAVQRTFDQLATERKLAEAVEGLRESEERYRTVLETMEEGYYEVDLAGNFTFFNDSLCRILGMSRDEMVGTNNRQYMSDETAKAVYKVFNRVYRTGEPDREFGWEVIRKDGTRIFVEASASLMRGSSGEPVGFRGIIRDITERRQAEEALRRSEEKYRLIAENVTDVIFTMDTNLRFTYISPSVTAQSGYSVEEAMARGLLDTVTPESLEVAANTMYGGPLEENMEEEPNRKRTTEVEVYCKDGSTIWLEVETTLLYDAEGEADGIMGVARDITERKRAEEALRESEEKLRVTFESMSDAVAIADLEGRFVQVNEAAARMTGYTREELVGRNVLETMIAKKDRDRIARDMTKALGEGDALEIQACALVDKDGRECDIDFSTAVLRDSSGNITNFVGVARDVTERRQAEEALKDSQAKLNLIFQSISDGIIVSDLEGRIIDENEAAVRLQGYNDKEEVIGRNGFEFIAERDRARATEDAMRSIEMGYGPAHEYTFVDKDGREYDAEASASLLRDSSGNAVGFISVFRDITERKQAEQALRMSEEKLRAMFESITDGIVVTDLQGVILDVNDVAARMTNLSKEEMVGQDGFSLIPREERNKVMEGGKKIVRGETEPVRMEHEVSPVVGSSSTTNLVLGTMYDSEGNPTGFIAIAQDITERKKAEEALKASEAKYRDLVESISDVIYSLDTNGIATYVSPVVESVLGYTPSELIGRSIADVVYREDLKSATEGFMDTLSGNTPPGEIRVVSKSGEVRWVRSSNYPIFEEDRVIGVAGVMTDITERKRAEEALQISEKRFQDIALSTGDWIWEVDANGKYVFTSGRVKQILGYSPEELIGKTPFELMPEEEAKHVGQIFKKIVAKKKIIVDLENWNLTKNGELVCLMTSGVPVIDNAGSLIGYRGIDKDITERKRAEEALRDSEEKMRVTFESIGDAVAVIDLEGRFVQVNEAAARISGYTKEELVGRNVLETIIAKKDRDKIVLDMAQTLGEGDALGIRSYTLVDRDGREFESEFSTAVLRDSSGNIINFVGVARDVTERKRAEEALQRTMAELERSNAELQQFAHIASHDLQEPLRMVASYTQLLEKRYKDKLDADASEFIAYAVDGAKRMQNLIQGLLSFSRVGSRGKPFEPTECESVFEQALANLKLTIDETGAEVTHDPLPRVMADETQLIQLFQNLLANAIKFRDEKQPRIHVSAKEDSNESLFSVSDNGIGISPEYFDRIFVIFQRLHGREEYPGTGIGLSVCKRIVERHGGRIWVESQPGEGSTFHFTIPKGGEEQ